MSALEDVFTANGFVPQRIGSALRKNNSANRCPLFASCFAYPIEGNIYENV